MSIQPDISPSDLSQTDTSTLTRLPRPTGHGTLQTLREQAMTRFAQTGLPRADEEEWRFTNTDPIAEVGWTLPAGEYDIKELFEQYSLRNTCAAEVVFINGVYSTEWSSVGHLSRGLFAGLLADGPVAALAKLGTAATIDKTPFVALNSGFLDQVTLVHAAHGALIDRPVHVLHLSTTRGIPLLFSPRTLVIAQDGATLSVVETHAGSAADALLSNAVTEVFVSRDAVLDHYHCNGLSEASWSITNTVSTLAAGATYTHHSVSYGARLVRNDLEVILDGPHADATLNGLVLARGKRQIDNHTLIRHEKPDCTSHELYKNVVADSAFGVFKGRIFVQKDAQHTDARQTNRTLLLSDKASMESMPALEIYADDVKCSHGSTTGPLDEDMLFYLRSRGLSSEAARDLLVYAFAADMTQRMKVLPIRKRLESRLAAEQDLPQDLSIEAS